MSVVDTRRRAGVRRRGPAWLFSCLLLILGLCALSSPPAPAQLVPTFTKGDCNQYNNPCGERECDEVFPPAMPLIMDWYGPSGARIQYVLEVENDDDVKSGLVLTDQLPACAQIDCSDLCIDQDCNTLPDAGPVQVTFSGGGFSDPPVCDETGNRLTVTGITLGPGELMDVRFCADFTEDGLCCNDAALEDPGRGLVQSAVDVFAHRPEVCAQIGWGGGGAWKDDCGPRTGHAEDCDDIGTTADHQRIVKPPPPSAGKRIRWILHLEHRDSQAEYRIEDDVPLSQTVICRDFQDPMGENWGCFHMYRNGQEINPGVDDACVNGPGGGIDVIEALENGDALEIHFCARISDDVGQMTCNRNAMYRTPPDAGFRIPFWNHLGGERMTCILAEPPRVRATKVITNLPGGVARPGGRVGYRIELCETTGVGDVEVHYEERIPANIIDPVLAPDTQTICEILGDDFSILCDFLTLPSDGCRRPTIIEWEGTATCDGLGDGDRICNQGEVKIRQPYDIMPVFTDDPANPASDRDPACFRLALDGLDDSTKRVDLTTDLDGDTLADCEEDVLTYTIEVVSSGSAGALQVELSDELPPEAIFVGGSLRLDGSPLPDPPGRTITLDLGDIPVGTSREITFQVRASDVGVGDYVLSNQGVLTSEDTRNCGTPVVTDDPITRLGNDPAHREIVCSAPEFGDATKSVAAADGQSVREAWPGMDLVYTVDWCNTGTGPATGVTPAPVPPPASSSRTSWRCAWSTWDPLPWTGWRWSPTPTRPARRRWCGSRPTASRTRASATWWRSPSGWWTTRCSAPRGRWWKTWRRSPAPRGPARRPTTASPHGSPSRPRRRACAAARCWTTWWEAACLTGRAWTRRGRSSRAPSSLSASRGTGCGEGGGPSSSTSWRATAAACCAWCGRSAATRPTPSRT